jgi:hypothetical protein
LSLPLELVFPDYANISFTRYSDFVVTLRNMFDSLKFKCVLRLELFCECHFDGIDQTVRYFFVLNKYLIYLYLAKFALFFARRVHRVPQT